MAVAIKMKHDKDPKEVLVEKLPDLSQFELFNNQVLVALYERPEETQSGVILTKNSRAEEEWQGKAALIISHGPRAFRDDDGKWFVDANLGPGDWIVMRPSDGWPIIINDVKCRIINDTAVRMRITSPDLVW